MGQTTKKVGGPAAASTWSYLDAEGGKVTRCINGENNEIDEITAVQSIQSVAYEKDEQTQS